MQRWGELLTRPAAIVAGLYAVLTVIMTWPLTPRSGSTLQDPGDPLFQIWVFRAVQHRLIHHPLDLYHANAFYPFHNSLAYSEEAISTAILAWPVYLLTGNDVFAYNFMFLSSFWLVGWAVYLLAKELGAATGAAFLAGLLAAFAPARFGHVSHLHMLVIGWLPLALWAFTVYARGGQRRYAALGGVSLVILLLGSLHLAVFGTLALGLYALFLLAFERRGRAWSRADLGVLAAALVIPYLIFVPTLLPHLAAGDEYGFVRTREEIERFSASPRSYLSVFPRNRFWSQRLTIRSEPFFPGAVTLAGAALSALWLWRGRERWLRWPAVFAGALAVTFGLLSLGFEARVAGRMVTMPYSLLYDIAPPIRNIRGVGRFGLLTAIGLPLLAGFGFTALWALLRERLRGRVRAREAGIALTALVALVACYELFTDVGTLPVPGGETMAVYGWLADQPRGPVAEFPANGLLVPAPRPPEGLFQPIQYMYGSTRHWNPILAGYSGYIPPGHASIISQFHTPGGELQSSMVTAENVGLLQDLGVRWVLVHRFDGYDWQAALDSADSLPQLTRVAEVGVSVVYELSLAGHEPLPETLGEIVVGDTAYEDAPLDVRLRLFNPRDTLAVGLLHREPVATVTWTDASGEVALREELDLPNLAVLRPGETTLTLGATTPDAPGEYTVEVRLDTDRLRPATQAVTLQDTPRWDAPPLELVAFDVSDTSLRPGETLDATVSWLVLEPLDIDLSATLQLLDANGERRLNHDLFPAQMPAPTSQWQEGRIVTLRFSIWIDPALPPGEYQLLTAVYFNGANFPRAPILLEGRTVATEAVVPGILVEP